ncbi:hypothetical protein BJV77DRAFT_1009312 [Russula vinacea]|nr:hypothetical protein BJV77DRAFT_1009312 [Russula vinacea]
MPPAQLAPRIQQPTLGGMGSMGANAPSREGWDLFNHILSRLPGELQKSRETGRSLMAMKNELIVADSCVSPNSVLRMFVPHAPTPCFLNLD